MTSDVSWHVFQLHKLKSKSHALVCQNFQCWRRNHLHTARWEATTTHSRIIWEDNNTAILFDANHELCTQNWGCAGLLVMSYQFWHSLVMCCTIQPHWFGGVEISAHLFFGVLDEPSKSWWEFWDNLLSHKSLRYGLGPTPYPSLGKFWTHRLFVSWSTARLKPAVLGKSPQQHW